MHRINKKHVPIFRGDIKMNLKKIIAALMSIMMLTTILASCASEPELPQETHLGQATGQYEQDGDRGQAQEEPELTESFVEDDSLQETTPTERPRENVATLDFEAAFAKFPPDTVMFTVGDFEVTWELLYFRIHIAVISLLANRGSLPDLSTLTPDGNTYEEMIMDFAVQASRQLRIGEYGARELGVQLSEEDLDFLELTVQENIAAAGGEEALLEYLRESYGIHRIELFRELLMLEYLPMTIFLARFGEMGSNLSDEEVALHFENDGFIMAKHILRPKSSDYPEVAREEIEDIHRRLSEYRGDDFEGFFDELMREYSGDPGVISFPDGYLFQAGDMADPFYEAAVDLNIGDMSNIVETTHGYHIILRLPIDYDTMVISDTHSLRARAAFELYEAMVTQWLEKYPSIFTAEFESLNLATLFEPCVLF